MTFSEVSAALDKALSEAKTKKDALDKATKDLKSAGDAYQASVYKSQELRGQLNAILNEALPAEELKPKIG